MKACGRKDVDAFVEEPMSEGREPLAINVAGEISQVADSVNFFMSGKQEEDLEHRPDVLNDCCRGFRRCGRSRGSSRP
jgi:hypothetical protein